MKRSEISDLLTLAASIDGRAFTEADVEAWFAMAEQGRWESFDAARRALLVYRSEQPDFPLRPGHITQVLERVRARASASFRLPTVPPDDAAADPAAYQAWVRDRAATHAAAVMAAFAHGDNLPAAIPSHTEAWR